MLFSYAQAREEELPKPAAQFISAAQILPAPTGMVFSPRAHNSFMTATSVDKEVFDLINAVTDEESKTRVDVEIKRRLVTSKIPEDLAGYITEAVEVLGLQKSDLSVAQIPLIVTLYTDHPSQEGVVINVTGVKALADAMRLVWSKAYTQPYPDHMPQTSIAVMRMPPVVATARVTKTSDTIRVEAVEGWGKLVGTPETPDVYTLDAKTLQFIDKQINTQESMITRNERTEQIVKTAPFNASSQKITDDQIRGMAGDVKRTNLDQAVFGLSNQKRWLLFVPQATPSRPAPQQEEVQESFAQEPEVEVVDLVAEESAPEPVEEEPQQPESVEEVAGEVEESVHSEPVGETQEVEDVQEPQEESEVSSYSDEYDEEPAQSTHTDAQHSKQHQQQAVALGSQLLEECLRTIEAVMREWLHDKDQPEDFGDLLLRVSSKRTVPYKQRILSLWEMKRQGAFESPDAETVRFGMETMERFVREFS